MHGVGQYNGDGRPFSFVSETGQLPADAGHASKTRGYRPLTIDYISTILQNIQ